MRATFEESTNLLEMITKTVLYLVSEHNIFYDVDSVWVCTRKYFFQKNLGVDQNTMFDPQVNFRGVK